ncbi:hypothetical protein PFISCL1PPCAC_22307, partial [Pristionchus fissidentatus]
EIYGRYDSAFMRRGGYVGAIDPVTLQQMAFFLNVHARTVIRDAHSHSLLRLPLNASCGRLGISIEMSKKMSLDVSWIRSLMIKGTRLLQNSTDKHFATALEKLIIWTWRECGGELKRRGGRRDDDVITTQYDEDEH